ncbi:putative minor capsid protein [Companilactobacillus sp. DQM5]|uniref:putative minor capsid protein n=1 Tax=Companilactobacillus sp. DQM5 TaxID=3463359 RepID=UPI0040584D65
MTELIDSSWLIHNIKIFKVKGTDEYNNPIYKDRPIELNHVRVNIENKYSGSQNNKEIVATATVFSFADFTENYFVADDSLLKAKVEYKGDDYKLVGYKNSLYVETDKPYQTKLSLL